MDRILSDYQFYFIFLSYAIFFTFFSGISLYYIYQFNHAKKIISKINISNTHEKIDYDK